MPNALQVASVSVETFQRWEHRMKRRMEAYGDGLYAKYAQMQVKISVLNSTRLTEGFTSVLQHWQLWRHKFPF